MNINGRNLVLLLLAFFLFSGVFLAIKIKAREKNQAQVVLAKETHKALQVMMVDLNDVKSASIKGVPADGKWYQTIGFENKQGAVQYQVHERNLNRKTNGQEKAVAGHFKLIQMRRTSNDPTLLEVKLHLQNKTLLSTNFNIRLKD